MNSSFEIITTLEYRLKAAKAELNAFKTGEKYNHMEELHLKEVRVLERKVIRLENELADSHKQLITNRNMWFDVYEELQKECEKKIAKAEKKAALMEKRAIKAEQQRDEALEKVKQQRTELYDVKTQLEEEREKTLKLTAQINRKRIVLGRTL